ncbi:MULTISPECIES: Gmad2 immunoglobulin-like domain-containing protein [Nocardioides]|uniref:Gmad2 immunoglobulin-like domain-containing protein n=1 Tax=Nocardioides vastitatis TaxID=2568655 RepID=A0ABW0ZK44_9ACTN|nr:Gmad2 immunoglobulin-like domain-containing protein [Nocardioides sp.]THJ04482.1 hypothetical protein E7Z54_08300 [Nocardioides sp.]
MQHTPRRTVSVLTGAVLALGLLAGCGDESRDAGDRPSTPASTPSAADTTTDATTEPTSGPTDDGMGEGAAVPVYYVGDTPGGDRLYREFTRVTGVERLVGAAAAVTQGDPVDPDYRTLWPGGRFTAVTLEADAIVVEVPEESWLEQGRLDRAQAKLAVQQLVYTLQGVVGKRLPVRVQYDGRPASTLLGVTVGAGLKATPELEVLAFVNITEPAEGTGVSDRFVAEGRASSFEATVIWEMQDSAGTVVLEGFAQAEGYMDKLYPWRTEVDASSLPPGDYTFVARTDDPSDGEGPGPTVDTKRITVQ